MRDSGGTDRAGGDPVVLLHGLGATGDYFGAAYDSLGSVRRVLVPDLLGFGRSLDEDRTDFSLAAHVEALDMMLDALDLGTTSVVIAAHSISSAIALSWARRHPARTGHVYLWGPPVYARTDTARAVDAGFGPMSRLLLTDTAFAEWACRLNCANRTMSGLLMAVLAPRWPTAISRQASQHTWDAYQGSLRSLVLGVDWSQLLAIEAPLTIWRGSEDPIGDRGVLARLVSEGDLVEVPEAGHHVALQRPDLLIEQLD